MALVTDTSIPPDVDDVPDHDDDDTPLERPRPSGTVDPDPNTYKRTFNDDELDALDAEVARRLNVLVAQGAPINIFALLAHQIVGLLEVMAGPERAKRVREWHLLYVSDLLDEDDRARRMAELLKQS